MQKILCGMLALVQALGFLCCGKPTDAVTSPESEAVIVPSNAVVFAGPTLEHLVRANV